MESQTVVYATEANSSPVEIPDNEATAYEMNAHQEKTESESMERAQEMGQQRERTEFTSSPGVSGKGRHV